MLLAGLAVSWGYLGDALTTEEEFTNAPESKRAEDLLSDRLRGERLDSEVIIVSSPTRTVGDPAFQTFVEDMYAEVVALGPDVVKEAASYYQTRDGSMVSRDEHTTIIPVTMAETPGDARIDEVLDVVKAANGKSGFEVLIAGDASIGKDFERLSQDDLQTGEIIGVPIALAVLVLVFGTVVAALIPLGLGLVAIITALGATAVIGLAWDLSFFIINMVISIGLAVGIDYSLFVVSRYREERRAGREKNEAIAVAGATASRTVLFSGATVVLALLGMLIVPFSLFGSLATGAILAVVAAVLAALTLLPAVLSLLGDRVNSLRVPLLRLGSNAPDASRGGLWDRVARGVMKRPVLSLVVSSGLLLAAAAFYLDIDIGSSGVSTLPDRLQAKQAFLLLDREFSVGLVEPAEIAIDGDIGSPEVQAAVGKLTEELAGDAAFGSPTVEVNQKRDLALFSVPIAGDPSGDDAINAVKRLRHDYVPQAFSGVDAKAYVGGSAAISLDYYKMATDYMPIVFAFVLGLSFLLLLLVFRSVVIPFTAIIMNLLSVGAAYGLLVLVFQKGIGADVLGFQKVETVEAWVPLFLFCVLFGLSMDYHVFLLSRIRERYRQTGDNSGSVAFGVRSTAGIITGAALIMVAVFGGFAMGDLVMFQQMGFGVGVAVLLDATVVRSVLVPAAMKLLGRYNWYLPCALRWLPDFGVTEQDAVESLSPTR